MKKYKYLQLYLFIIIITTMNTFTQNGNQDLFPFRNYSLSFEERVNDLVGRMTLVEKIKQMSFRAPSIERLGIPAYNWWNECLHGVARAGAATVFPQAINLASTWDTDLIFKVATAISDEARAKHHEFVRKDKRGIYEGLTFWSPNINIFRDPRWGRGHETYGEDPYLTGEIGFAFVKGLQGDDPKYLKIVSTPKHYAVHSGPEPERHTFDAKISERDLRETYLPAFRRTLVDAKAYSVMCAYNRFRGKPCCGSDELLQKILREEWKFDGYVVSDCWAVEDFYQHHKVVNTPEEAVSLAVKMGTDLSCGDCYGKLIEAVQKGLITEKEIDVSIKRLFLARFKLGMFDPPELVPYTKIPYSISNSKEHDKLALETARKSIVLLKNENNLLPLDKNKIKKIAVIGPNANDIDVLLGNYNGTPTNPITVLKGIQNKVNQNCIVEYAQGCDLAEGIRQYEPIPSEFLKTINGKNGLTGEYFTNSKFEGKPAFTKIDEKIDFNWWDKSPDSKLDDDNFSIRWTGFIVPKKSGAFYIGTKSLNYHKIFFEDTLLVEGSSEHEVYISSKPMNLVANKSYKIVYEFAHSSGDATAELIWSGPKENQIAEAEIIAKDADVIIMVLGLSPRLEGEESNIKVEGFLGGDRTNLELPKTQLNLLMNIYKLGKPVVLVLMNGSALAVNWADENVPAILQIGYPGQQGGAALADVLFGDYNPAGRLPVTYYKSIDQIPPFDNYDMEGRTYRYFKGEPLYPFGFGLSYAQFKYSDFKIENEKIKTGENMNLSIEIENTGKIDGEEVVQVYISHKSVIESALIRSLKGFKRIKLPAGKKESINFVLTPGDLSVINDKNERVVLPGEIEISVGGKQPGFSGSADPKTTEVITKTIRIDGSIYKVEYK